MEELERAGDLGDDLAGLALAEVHALLDAVQQLAAVYLLEDEVEALVVLEELDQLDDVGVALTVVEGLDLLEDALARVPRDLVDDLDGVLEVRVQRGARLHRGVRALAQHLTRQLVQLCKGQTVARLSTRRDSKVSGLRATAAHWKVSEDVLYTNEKVCTYSRAHSSFSPQRVSSQNHMAHVPRVTTRGLDDTFFSPEESR